MEKKILITLNWLSRALLIAFIMVSLFQSGAFYGKWNQGEGVYEFFTKEYTATIEKGGEIPQIILLMNEEYNKIVRYIWIALFFLFLRLGIDYFIDPDNHFITSIKNKFKGGLNE